MNPIDTSAKSKTQADIPTGERTEMEIGRQAEMLRLSFDAIIIWRLEGGIESWNRGAEELYGFTQNEAIGHRPHDLLRTAFPIALAEIEAALQTVGNWEGELRHRTKSGREVVVLARLQLIRGEDEVARVLEINRDITTRKEAEAALRQSERLYRGIGEAIDYGVWVCDRDGRNIYASESFLKMVGITQEQCSNFGWGNVLHPDDGERTIAAWKECVRTEGRWDIEHRFRGVDGQWHHVLARGVPIRDEQGRITCWAGINLDVTARKAVEQQLAASLEAMTRLQKLGTLYVRDGDLEPILSEIVEAAIAIAGADFGDIQLLDPATGGLRIVAQRGLPEWWVDYWNRTGGEKGCCGMALERGERVVVEDVEQSPIFVGTPALEMQLKARVRAVQSTPLVSRSGEALGMFSTHYSRAHRPDKRTLALLDLLARQASDIIARTQAEQALRRKQAELQVLFDHTPAGLVLFEAQPPYKVLAHNRYYQELFAEPYRTSGMVGLNVRDYAPAVEAAGVVAVFDEVARTGQPKSFLDFTYQSNPPRESWFNWHMLPLILDGKVVALVSMSINVTDRHLAEAALRANEARLRTLYASMTEGLATHEIVYAEGQPMDYILTDVNPAFEKITGILRVAAVGRKATELYGTGNAPYLEVYARVAAGGSPEAFETYFAPMQKHFAISVFSPERGKFATVFSDITERKQAEEELRAALREKEVLLKEVHHRVKNNMQVLSSLVGLQAEGIKDAATRMVFNDFRDQVRTMALVHENLYHSESLARVNFAEYTRSLSGHLARAHGRGNPDIQLTLEVEPVSLPIESAVPCGLILNELVSNAYKHAFRDRASGEVVIKVGTESTGRVCLGVRDNGVGLPAGLDWRQSMSLGLRLVEMLARQVHGEVEVCTEGGTAFQLTFTPPESKPAK